MAYLVTSGSHFTPFTYDELVKPLAQATEAHNTAAEAYGQLAMESAALSNYIDEQKDVEASRIYNNYMTRLNTLQDNLWNKGYNAGTVRDLTAARAGYASDITRLAKAIESRQARSNEYWEMRRKNPDLVTGVDPGISSLDDYLRDDNYGKNWFSYSGNQLASEVAADVEAKTADILRNPEVLPSVYGYITMKRQQGVTHEELNNAGTAAKAYLAGDTSALDNLDPYSRIIADSLVEKMTSTGAKVGETVDQEGFDRLLGYAMTGAATGGIHKPDIKDYEDKRAAYGQQIALENLRHQHDLELQGLKNQKPTGNGSGAQGSDSYTMESVLQTIQSQRATKTSTELNKEFDSNFKRDANGNVIPITVKLSDGRTVPTTSTEEITNYWINTPERRTAKERYNIDFELPYGGTTETRQKFVGNINGKQVLLVTGKLSDKDAKELGISTKNPIAIMVEENGKHIIVPTATKEMNRLLQAHQARKAHFEELNGGSINFRKMTNTPKEMQKLAESHGLDAAGLTPSQVKSAVITKSAFSTRQSPAVIAPSSGDFSKMRDDILSAITDSYLTGASYSGTNKKDGKGKSGKQYAFYRTKPGGLDFDEHGTTKLDEVFGTLKDGKPKSGSIQSVVAYPHDLEKGMVRIITPNGPFGVKIEMLQSIIADTVANPEFNSVLNMAMFPFEHPDEVHRMSEEENQEISANVAVMLGENHAPVYTTASGPQFITFKDVIDDPDMRGAYYKSLVGYMNDAFANARWLKSQYNYQERSDSGDARYEPYL